MKFPLFFLLALCVSKAASYGLYGCYERLLYWQAYQMDSGSKKQKIAKSCSTDGSVLENLSPVKGGRCNLRQFLYYITKNNDEKAIIAGMSDEDLKLTEDNLDKVASKLYKAGVGSTIHPGRIYENLRHDSTINELIHYVGAFIQQKRYLADGDKSDKELFNLAEQARSRALYERRASAARDIGGEIRKKYDYAVWEKQPKDKKGNLVKDPPLVDEGLVKEKLAIPDGAVDGWPTCDLVVAEESVNAEETKAGRAPINVSRDFVGPWVAKEESHKANIAALKAAQGQILGCPA